MKKFYSILIIGALTTIISCTKAEMPESYQDINCNISVCQIDDSPATKALKTGWANGDILNIWFDSNKDFTPNLTLTYNGSTWDASKVSTTILDALKASGGTIKVLWEGNNDLSGTFVASEYGSSTQFTTKDAVAVSRILAKANINYTYESSTKTLSANISDLHDYTAIQVTVPGLVGEGWMIHSESMHALAYIDIQNAAIGRSTYYANKNILGQTGVDGYVFYAGEIKSDYFNSALPFEFTLTDGVNSYKYTTVAHELILNRGTSTAYPFKAIKLPTFDGEAATPANWIKQ